MKRYLRHIILGCLAVFFITLASCERETWLSDMERRGTGKSVNVLLSFEVPQADTVAVTRTMSELEEHNVTDLYVLVFDAETQKLVSRQYYDNDALNVSKVIHLNGTWGSVLENTTNSTHGTVMAKAIDNDCLIFGIANVRGADNEVAKSVSSAYSKLDDALLAMKTINLDAEGATTLDDFYALQAELKNDLSLGRDNTHLLMSGVFVLKDKYKSRLSEGNDYEAKYWKGKAGLVSISQAREIEELTDENGNVDLTQAGVIRLRRVASHIKFKVTVNQEFFSDFKPESWQVIHMPRGSYLMDQGDQAQRIETEEGNFFNSPEMRYMLHAEGSYQFDFYMYENHKDAQTIDGGTDYYYTHYGSSITSEEGSQLNALFNGDAESFKYAKRELALKDADGKYMLNSDGSKRFVYVEPYATYVIIKGRLRFNTANFQLKDLIQKDGDDKTTTEDIKDGYASVTYLVHLGYAREMNLRDGIMGVTKSGAEKTAYRLTDFNSLRNTEYTYNVKIQGVNSIYTQVVTESDDDDDKREPAKLQTGASGFIGMATENVFNTDAHFNSFIIFLDKSHLDKDAIYFEIKTPWNTITSNDITDDNYEAWYKDNPDFNWIKVRRNYDQTMGDNDDYISYSGSAHRAAMPYYKASGDDYQEICPLIDLYQLKKEMEVFATSGLEMKKDDTVYNGTGGHAKVKFSDLSLDDTDRSNNGLFYTVFLDEYYYQKPPLKEGVPVWNHTSSHEPYWHEFVNKPARFVSFSTTAGATVTTHDKESSIIKPQLMIVQPSIQTHYSTEGTVIVGLGMEHYNETPHPRWKDSGSGGSVPTSGLDKKSGWKNAKTAIVKNTVTWGEYVANYVGKYNNLAMAPVSGNLPTPKTGEGNGDEDAQYKANAIRLCMNRNRDENGNGQIDEDELKWYLPSSEQIDLINMCHFSFYDPLLNYNDYIYGTDAEGNVRYRLKNVNGQYTDDFYGRNYYQFHFVTSDYMKLIGEEMMNLNTYTQTGNWATRPGEMRCVRNLGQNSSQTHVVNMLKPYFSYDAEGNVVSDLETMETQEYPGADPDEIFKFEPTQVSSGSPWENKVFVMEKYLDSRSVRTAKYVNEELPPHYIFSETNRPYKAFQVAKNAVVMRNSDARWKHVYGDKAYINLKDIYDMRPCGSYYEEADKSDSLSWRAPNAAELSLMIHYLRVNNSSGTAKENGSPALFFNNTSDHPFTTSSENWTGALWVRMMGIKSDGALTRKLYLSDPYKLSADGKSVSSSYKFGEANIALRDGTNVMIRCVKDIDP